MSFRLKHGLFFLLLLGGLASYGQDQTEQEQIIQRRIETIAEQLGEGDEGLDYNTLLDELLIFSENPINLNNASFEDLAALPMLDEIAAANLVSHVEKHGKLLNLYELQAVDGFSLSLIRQLQPFIKVSDNPEALTFSFKEMMKEGEHEIVFRYQQVLNQQEGYSPIEDSVLAESPNRRYLGSPQKYWARYRFRYSNKVSWGLTMEKDAGEEFFKGSMKQGFDFYSGHLFVQNLGVVKSAALGDFQAQFGQGLVFWSGLAFGKSSDGVSIKRNAQGLRPYTSVDENRFLRGGGATLQFGKFQVTAFGSYKLLDGNVSAITDTLTEQEETVSSIFSSGFHRTPGELEDRQSLTEAVYGGNVSYKGRRLSLGITAVGYQFSKPIQRSDDLSNIFEFSGKQNSNYGLDYSYIFRNFHFFGEFALSQNLGFATTHGLYMTVDPRVTLTVMVRHLQPKYQALYANAVTENSRMNNETGYYLGFNINPFKGWYLNGFFDIFQFPWLRYQVNGPSFGYEAIGQLIYRPSKTLEVYFRFRQKNKQLNQSSAYSEAPIRGIENELRSYYRLNIQYSLTKEVKLRSRVEYSRYKRGEQDVEQGFMMYQDVIYSPLNFPLSFSARLAYFDTETYNARIYAYENDVLYAYSFPAYYYRGIKTYLTLRYNIYKGIDAWFRVGNIFYSNRDHVGSGLEETPKNHRTDIKVQLRFKF
ncbi:MAG: helix-hairpin-helix domain-containing protein [Flavobacteriales bacterium]|nr:helix-hairpin-helix domain-containing protein [Flavobacteriales bacterium]MCB9204824.1 helix-hairpin-helix domain-containing protein [Flavobacteriales bacterium]